MNISKFKENIKSVIWIIVYWLAFKRKLEHVYNIKNIKIFKFLNWHSGAYYFTGDLDNTKVFIKTDFVFNLLINEDTAFRIFSNDSYLKDKIIDVVLFSSDDRFIIMRYVDSQNILGFLDENPSESMNIIISMIEIVEALHNLNIVHRDIKMDNFIVVDKKLLLIDFLFCIDAHGQNRFRELTLNVRNSKNVLKHMNYSGKPDDYIWDDAYSLLQIYKIISKKHHIEKKIKSKIEKSIGKKQYILHQ